MKSIEKVAQTFLKHDKDAKVKIVDEGFMSQVYIVNDAFILCVASGAADEYFYNEEKEMLDCIAPHVQVRVPQLDIREIDGKCYSWHKMIEGKTYFELNRDSKISTKDKWNIAKDLAQFMADLKSYADAEPLEIKPLTKEDVKPLRKVLGTHMGDMIKKYLDYDFEGKQYYLSLIHGDLNEKNIIIKDGRVSGIIDFDNIARAPKSADLAVLIKYDVQLAHMISREYFELTGVNLDIEFAMYLAIHRAIYGLLDSLDIDSYIVDLDTLRENKMAAHYLRRLERMQVMCEDVFRGVLDVSDADIREAIYEAYKRMGYKNSDGRAEAMIDTWCWMWEDSEHPSLMNIEARTDNGEDGLEDIYATLNNVRSCFIDQEINLYESFDELVEASNRFHYMMGEYIFRGYIHSPWLPEYELQGVSCSIY